MATTKVTIKKHQPQFQWAQTPDTLSLSFPVRNIVLKHIDLLMTSLFLKLNISSLKLICVIDFQHPIDYEHASNCTQLLDDRLEITLQKRDKGVVWEGAQVEGVSKEELKRRREDSLREYYQREEDKRKEAEKRKLEMDKHSIDQQMKVENFQRRQLRDKQEEEKKRAEEELYRDIEDIEERH